MARHIYSSSRGRGIRSAAILSRQSSSQVASPSNNVVSQEGPFSIPNPQPSLPTPVGLDAQPNDVDNQPTLSSTPNLQLSPVHPTPDSGTPSSPLTPIVSENNEESIPLPTIQPDTRELIEVIGTKKSNADGRRVDSQKNMFIKHSIMKSEVNKRNRAITTERGITPYRGGSITTTAHMNKMKDKYGHEPDPKEIFERTHRKKRTVL